MKHVTLILPVTAGIVEPVRPESSLAELWEGELKDSSLWLLLLTCDGGHSVGRDGDRRRADGRAVQPVIVENLTHVCTHKNTQEDVDQSVAARVTGVPR